MVAILSQQGISFGSLSVTVLANPINVIVNNLHNVENLGWHVAAGSGMMQMMLISLMHGLAINNMFFSDFDGRGISRFHMITIPAIHRIIGTGIMAFWSPIVLLLLGGGTVRMDAATYLLWFLFLWLVMITMSGMAYYLVRVLGQAVGALLGMSIILTQVSGIYIDHTQLCPCLLKIGAICARKCMKVYCFINICKVMIF